MKVSRTAPEHWDNKAGKASIQFNVALETVEELSHWHAIFNHPLIITIDVANETDIPFPL